MIRPEPQHDPPGAPPHTELGGSYGPQSRQHCYLVGGER